MYALQARVQLFSMLFGVLPNQQAGKALGPELSPLFSDPMVLLFLLVWLVLPVGVGLIWFRETDL